MYVAKNKDGKPEPLHGTPLHRLQEAITVQGRMPDSVPVYAGDLADACYGLDDKDDKTVASLKRLTHEKDPTTIVKAKPADLNHLISLCKSLVPA